MPSVEEDTELASLSDVTTASLPEQKYFDGLPFPLVLVPAVSGRSAAEWHKWTRENVDTLKSLLVRYGSIFFRGFPFDDPEHFDLFAKSFGWTEFPYVGGVSVRKPIVGNVYTSTESPPHCKIPFHHEMAHVKDHPKVLFAYCDVAPPEGGETPLLLSNVVYRKMVERDPAFVQRLTDEGLCYVRVAPEVDDNESALGRSWKSTFFADDRETGEANAKKAGFKVEWTEDGSMKYTSAPLPAIRVEPRTGKTTWFNSAHTCYIAWSDARNERTKAVLFPNGEQMNEDSMKILNEVMAEASVSVRWQKGDVSVVDNLLVQHSRNHFTPPRRVLISLFKD